MAASPQQNLNRHHLLLITLLHLLGNQASTQATGLNAQHVAGIDPPGTICSCMNTQKPPNSIPHTSKVESSGRADSACSHSCLMSCSDSERRSDIPDTEGRGLGVSLTEVSRKRPVVLWEAGTSLPETACATVSPALSPFHFLGLDENKVKKQRWVIFHPPAPELQKPSVLKSTGHRAAADGHELPSVIPGRAQVWSAVGVHTVTLVMPTAPHRALLSGWHIQFQWLQVKSQKLT